MKQFLQKSTKALVLMCLMLISTISWGQTETITINLTSMGGSGNIGSSNYASGAERTWTQSGVTFGGKAVTAATGGNAGSVQLQATNGVIYNKTALPGRIVSVVVTSFTGSTNRASTLTVHTSGPLVNATAANYNVTGGDSQGSSTPGNWTISTGDYTYFAIKRGGTVAYWEQVVITYETVPSDTPPTAADVAFSGIMNVGALQTGAYTYDDAEDDAEGDTTFQWYRADDASGAGEVAIGGATSITYTLQAADEAKYIRLGVTPVDENEVEGDEVFSTRKLVNTRPVASLVTISGVFNVTQTLTGNYTYTDANDDPEGESLYEWTRADDASGTNAVTIAGADEQTYILQAADLGKYIRFGVLPVDDNLSDGEVVYSEWSGPVSEAGTPSLTVSEILTENSLDGEIITLTLVNDEFVDATLNVANFTLNNAPSGLTIDEVVWDSSTTALLSFSYNNTDFDTDITNFSITIAAAELDSNANLTSADMTIFAETEVLEVAGTLTFGNQCQDQASAPQSFTISGTSLKNANINLAALAGYTYSESEFGTYDTTLSFGHSGGDLASKTIYVIFTPNAVSAFNGDIVVSSLGATSQEQTVTGSGINTIPTVTSPTSTAITANSATLGGNITVEGCNEITSRGVEISTTDGFANGTGDDYAESGSFATGTFTVNVTGLLSNTTYYYKAFATSTSGTAYSEQGTFTTNSIAAPVALAGTLVGSDNFTANWEAVSGATSYEIDVYQGGITPGQNVAVWTFPTDGTIVTPDIASANNTSQELTVNGGTSAITSGGGLSTTQSANATNWTSGSGSKFWQIEINTIGFSNLKLSSTQRSSGTGPKDFKVQYNNGSGWVDVSSGNVTVANNNTTGILSDLLLPTECENQGSVLIRWIMTSNTSVNNAAVQGGGTSRIDDIYVVGDLSEFEFVPGYNALNVGSVTSYQVTGLDPETTYFYVVRALDATSESENSNEIEVETAPIITWNGTAWNNIDGPTITDDAVIAGIYNSTGSLSAKNLTVMEFLGDDEVGFILNPGHTLTLSGSLINNGDEENVVFTSGSYFIQTSDAANTGEVTISRSAQIKLLDIVLWSSPVEEQNLLALSPNTLTNRFFTYNEENNNWQIVGDVANHQMGVGTGYGVRAPANWSTEVSSYLANFKGVPNNGLQSVTITSEHPTARYNGIGNPFLLL